MRSYSVKVKASNGDTANYTITALTARIACDKAIKHVKKQAWSWRMAVRVIELQELDRLVQ